MKYVKMLGLLAVAAAALMAFAGTAAATTVTSSEGETPTIVASAATTELHAGDSESFLTVSCKASDVKGKVTAHGSTTTASGPIETLHFTECSDPVTVLKTGTLEVHTDSSKANGNGTLTSSGAEIRIHTSEGPVCTFKTSNTDIGTVTGGHPASLSINSASIPASGFLCPSTGVWTGGYTVTSPTELSVH